MKQINVLFPNEPPSPVYVETDGFAGLEEEFRKLTPSKVVAISDENVWPIYGGRIGGIDHVIVLPAGEKTKSLDGYTKLVQQLAELKIDRNALLVGVGGGVVTDLVGFAASTYKRGVRFSFVATSLMAQLDAAIGGKCGIDLPEGKNLLGRFARPEAVYCFISALATLPKREIKNGLAEAVKYAFISDAKVLPLFEGKILCIESLVTLCARTKAKIVNADPFEQSGARAILNFGHTVGHAIEQCQKYEGLLHGEAIAIGMMVEAYIGQEIGKTELIVPIEIEIALKYMGLPTRLPKKINSGALLKAMAIDKKNLNGDLSMSLVTSIGHCKLVRNIPTDAVSKVLQRWRN